MSFEELAEAVERLGVRRDELIALSIHGTPAVTGDLGSSSFDLLIVPRRKVLKISRKSVVPNVNFAVIVGAETFRKDCVDEEYGGTAAHLLLFPYRPIVGERFLKSSERSYKRHVALEALRNLVLEHRRASSRIIIKPEYFLYEKLRRLSTTYPPARPLIRAVYCGSRAAEASEASVKGFKEALEGLMAEGVLRRAGVGYSPTPSFVEEALSSSTYYTKVSEELEHAFKLYLTAGQASPLSFLRAAELDFKALTPPKLPDPNQMLYIQTSLGLQPLNEGLGIREFIQRTYGVEGSRVRVKRMGGMLNAAYMASFNLGGEEHRIFVKKYLNWTDFKWVVAWLWALGVKNFSVLASTRMGNEIFFVNKLAELGFNTAEILHVSWPRKLLFQRFIQGVDGVRALREGAGGLGFEGAARAIGRTLARLHLKGVCMGDCNPHSFLFTPSGEIYLTDLEQCSLDRLMDWDLAELLYYTGHYLTAEEAERFAFMVVEGYLEGGGDASTVEAALNQRYSRLLALWTPMWIQRRVEKGARDAIRA